MRLRPRGTIQDFHTHGIGDLLEMHAASRYPHAAEEMLVFDSWCRWVMATDHKWSVQDEANDIIQRARGV